jgi:hypothetical protein|tara:strand:- start:447 stop:1343 length:897 start_codon:yes stop_codon:yes gene_type:complete
MSADILTKVQVYLHEALNSDGEGVTMPPHLIQEFKDACGDALEKQFNAKDREYRIRMSGIGRPLCQQKLDKDPNVKPENDYTLIMKFLLGDLIEAVAIAVMKASGVDIEEEQKPVELNIANMDMKGTYDVKIANKIYDIKSTSPAAFASKFGAFGGYDLIKENDPFGYVKQGYLYSEASGSDFGGWIAINKSTGEWAVCQAPDYQEEDKKQALAEAVESIERIVSDEPFKREFEDIPETYKDSDRSVKLTGNRLLSKDCSFCGYKKHCWPKVKLHRKVNLNKKRRPLTWYSKLVCEEL